VELEGVNDVLSCSLLARTWILVGSPLPPRSRWSRPRAAAGAHAPPDTGSHVGSASSAVCRTEPPVGLSEAAGPPATRALGPRVTERHRAEASASRPISTASRPAMRPEPHGIAMPTTRASRSGPQPREPPARCSVRARSTGTAPHRGAEPRGNHGPTRPQSRVLRPQSPIASRTVGRHRCQDR